MCWNPCGLSFAHTASNSFSKAIPSSLSNHSLLNKVYLDINKFSGPLPVDFTLPNIVEIHLSQNLLTGTLPSSLGRQPKLRLLELSDNYFQGKVLFRWCFWFYVRLIVCINDVTGTLMGLIVNVCCYC